MATSLNRAIQVRTADRLRAELARDELSGLPAIDALSDADEREMVEVGGGRLAAIAIVVESFGASNGARPARVGLDTTPADDEATPAGSIDEGPLHEGSIQDAPLQVVQVLMVREVVGLVREKVRRTDLLAALHAGTLIVLASGLDPLGGRCVAQRLRELLANRHIEVGGLQLELRVQVGAAFRSTASPPGWTVAALAAEAQHQAGEHLPIQSVA